MGRQPSVRLSTLIRSSWAWIWLPFSSPCLENNHLNVRSPDGTAHLASCLTCVCPLSWIVHWCPGKTPLTKMAGNHGRSPQLVADIRVFGSDPPVTNPKRNSEPLNKKSCNCLPLTVRWTGSLSKSSQVCKSSLSNSMLCCSE